eukprot:1306944-Rhodomonas_salina.3
MLNGGTKFAGWMTIGETDAVPPFSLALSSDRGTGPANSAVTEGERKIPERGSASPRVACPTCSGGELAGTERRHVLVGG